jgi:SAM-dependent methyltransferase
MPYFIPVRLVSPPIILLQTKGVWMKWYYRWMVRLFLGYCPFPAVLRNIKRRFSVQNTANAEAVMNHGLAMIDALERASCAIQGKTVFELGAGWEPIIPLLCSLKGAGKVYLFDLNRVLDPLSLLRCLIFLSARAEELSARLLLSPDEIRKKLSVPESLKTIDEKLGHFRLDYHAPADARKTALAPESIDIIMSHNVLEHIPLESLRQLFREANRILGPRGRMCHMIDNSDHYHQEDRSISAINFLRYDESFWNIINRNRLDCQNRLRDAEYQKFFQDEHFEIIADLGEPIYSDDAPFTGISFTERFRALPVTELSKQSFLVAGKKQPGFAGLES